MAEQGLEFMAQIWVLRGEIGALLVQHVLLAAAGVCGGAVIAAPAGVFISRHPVWGEPLAQFCGMLYTAPSLARLGLLIPFLGLGLVPTIGALTIYALLPLLRNTCVGIREVDAAFKEAATGMGATDRQLLGQVEWPLDLPFIMGGWARSSCRASGLSTTECCWQGPC